MFFFFCPLLYRTRCDKTYYLQLGQLPDVSRQELEIVVTQVESTKSGCKTNSSVRRFVGVA